MNIKKIILNYLYVNLRNVLNVIEETFFDEIEELRIRVNKPLIIIHKNEEYFIAENKITKEYSLNTYKPSVDDINHSLSIMSRHSLYAFNEELKNGYITLCGGHRVGLTGKTVIENGQIKTLKNINGLNIRISHEVKGCADEIIDYILDGQVLNTMIISPPGCGKTTLLRDLIRQLSNGEENKFIGQAVGIADERSEIAGCYEGVPQNDVGIRTDVLDGCPKAEGMIMLLRAMAPKIIAVDEIGKDEDVHAIDSIVNAGVKLICTVHGYCVEDIKNKSNFANLFNRKIFGRFIVLAGPNNIKSIFNENFKPIKL